VEFVDRKMMIPGAWEPRRRSGASVAESSTSPRYGPFTSVPNGPTDRRGNESGGDTQLNALRWPPWLKVSIYAAALLAAKLLAMWAARFNTRTASDALSPVLVACSAVPTPSLLRFSAEAMMTSEPGLPEIKTFTRGHRGREPQ
jgi:hypothetical protein